jgi:hypothetical protein
MGVTSNVEGLSVPRSVLEPNDRTVPVTSEGTNEGRTVVEPKKKREPILLHLQCGDEFKCDRRDNSKASEVVEDCHDQAGE